MKKLLLASLISGVLVVTGVLVSRADQATQYRYANSFVKSLSPQWTAYMYEEFNFGGNGNHNLFAQYYEPGFVYSGLAKWFDVTMALGKCYSKTGGDWQGELTPFVVGTVKWSSWGLEMSNAFRFDYNHRDKAEDRMLYHDVFSISTEKKWTKLGLQPFVANEAIYDFDAEIMNSNQLKMGLNFKVTKSVGASVFYMRNMSHSNAPDNDHWKTTPMVGLVTTISF